jgi:DNA-binding transcriptional LysR family regulator
LSKSLRSLEREFKVRLMERGPKGMTATVFGESLAAHARVIRSEFSRAAEEMDELRGVGRRRVAIGVTHSFASALVPAAVTALLRKRPEMRVSVTQGLFQSLIPMLLRGDLDLVVMTLHARSPASDLAQIVLRADRSAVMVQAGHPLARRKRLAIADLLAYPLLMTKPGDRSRVFAEERFAAAGLKCDPCVEFDSVTFAREMLLKTDMVTFLPVEVFRPDLDAGTIVILPVRDLDWLRPVGILHGKRTLLSRDALALIGELKSIGEGRADAAPSSGRPPRSGAPRASVSAAPAPRVPRCGRRGRDRRRDGR